ncbi:MAG TPA: transglutaminase family protein [Rubrivivax sp.]
MDKAAVEVEVVHDTRYSYSAPVSQAHHLAHMRPLDDQHQQVREFELRITPVPSRRVDGVDPFGNACCHFALAQPHRKLELRSRSLVGLRPRFETLDAARSPPWELLRDRLRYVARAPFDPAVEFVQPSPYVPRLEVLRTYGAMSFTRGRPLAEGALELMRRVHADFDYLTDSTEIDTPLATAFAQRSGVCQDFTHVMAGALRMLGLPARYVSGYLITQHALRGPALVGADASHAWVQVYCPGTPGVPGAGWLDLDPTNDVVPSTAHVRLAVGRDYGDVAPLRGIIRGAGRHSLDVGVATRVLETAR